MKNDFKTYALSKDILDALHVLGYDAPTPIQSMVLPAAFEQKDIVGKAQTGSGKTAAFGIPLCEEAVWEENLPTALVLEPTRELTVQTRQELYFIGRKKRLKVADVFGGFPIDKQIQTLRQKCHIVVGTPGRVMDHIRRGSLDLSKVKRVVIDEADLMLDMGFEEEVREILSKVPQGKQMMLFSATLGERIEAIIAEYLTDPLVIEMKETEEKLKIEEGIYEVSSDEKYEAFLHVLINENPDSCMIFCGTKEMVNVLCRKLRKDGVKCGMIHGDIEQQDRIRTVDAFREGRFRYLIATDVVARGIDFDHLTHVFNYDFPTGKETYVHRIGRTGRNGRSGKALSFVTETDTKMRQMVEGYVQYTIPVCKITETVDKEKAKEFFERQKEKPVLRKKKGAEFNKLITKLSIGGGKKGKLRAVDIVGTICSIEGMTADDIGAIDIRESITYVEILNNKGKKVEEALQHKAMKGKVRKVRITK